MGEEEFDHSRSFEWTRGNRLQKIQLKKLGEWIIDPIYSQYGVIKEYDLEKVRNKLNEQVNNITEIRKNNDEADSNWCKHLRKLCAAKTAVKRLQEELENHLISKAYVKFMEIVCAFPEIIRTTKPQNTIRSFHLCEAPGQFILALDRFLSTFHPKVRWGWNASSLNPHHEFNETKDMFIDDRIINSYPNSWWFNKNKRGDIFEFKKPINNIFFDLVTADGSNFAKDDTHERRELNVLSLLEAEFNAAIQMLQRGGSFVMKIYSMHTFSTRKFLKKVMRFFNDIWIFKPMASSSNTNERYLIAKGFLGRKTPAPDDEEVLSKREDKIFQLAETFFSEHQSAFLYKAIDFFDYTTHSRRHMWRSINARLTNLFKRIHLPFLRKMNGTYLKLLLAESSRFCKMVGDDYIQTLYNYEASRNGGKDLVKRLEWERRDYEWPQEPIVLKIEKVTSEMVAWLKDSETIYHNEYSKQFRTTRNLTNSLFIKPTDLATLMPTGRIADLFPFNDDTNTPNLKDICQFEELEEGLAVDVQSVIHSQIALVILNMALFNFTDLYPPEEEERLKKCMKTIYIRSSVNSPIPMILSRFAASWLSYLSLIYGLIEFNKDGNLITFSSPMNDVEVRKSMLNTISLDKIRREGVTLLCFNPICILERVHKTCYDFNQTQIRRVLDQIRNEEEN